MSSDSPAHSWQGFYFGGFVGGVAAEDAIRLTPNGRWLQDTEAPFLAYKGSPTLKAAGFLGGIEFGYNYRVGRIVLGPEADLAGTALSAKRRTGPFPPYVETGDVYRFGAAFRSNFLSTIRGRIGVLATERILLFVTGGVALADLTYSNGYGNDLGPGLVDTYTPLRSVGARYSFNAGWSVGAGAELAIARRWTIKAEYLHADLGQGRSFVSGERLFGAPQANGFFVNHSSTLTENVGKMGLNYSLP